MIATIWKGKHPITRGKKVWIVTHKNRKTKDFVNTGSDAFRYWLWAMGVSPKIAFGWFRKNKSEIKKKENVQR